MGPTYEQTGIEWRLSESGAVFGVIGDAGLIEQTVESPSSGPSR
ncbi:MAG: hypothetical protein ACREDH_14135 [Methylocella sp.]